MSKILVYAEYHGTKIKSGTLELLNAAKASGQEVAALIVGPGSKACAAELGHHGASTVFCCESAQLANYSSELYLDLVSDSLAAYKADVILASGSSSARDLFPRVAAKFGAGIAADVTHLSISGSDVSIRKPFYSGKCSAEVKFENCSTKIVLMRANQLPVGKADPGKSPEVKELALKPRDLRSVVKEVVKGSSSKLDLTEANIIVAGGRGMKGAEHFKLIETLADVLGATVGASRAVVDAGWVGHSLQVGQTGKTVAPTLYIACGISGAIQHLAGMSSSKVIVAINKDPEAPIFKKATYGIVGDVFEVLPVLTEEFKKVLAH